MNLHIHLEGADQLIARLTDDAVQDPLSRAVEDVANQIGTPKGSGMGVRVNSLGVEIEGLSATVTSSTNWPRTTGISWLTRSEEDAQAIAEASLASAEAEIESALGG